MNNQNNITVFEHSSIFVGQVINGVRFDNLKLEALQNYYGEKGVPYYTLVHKGIRFNQYVGVIQVGNLVIEVLPKADNNEQEEDAWRKVLIGMLKSIIGLDVKVTSNSNLKLRPNSILDLYVKLFLSEVEYLLHAGLLKKYRKIESNTTSLKGNLQFSKNIQHNLVHQERFYTRHTIYDIVHKLHFILYKTLKLLIYINTDASLLSRINSLLLYFPDMPNFKIEESTFDTIIYTRKSNSYKKALQIARLLLLNYHPDIIRGRNDVLALMFDMNLLWEKFIFISLRKNLKDGVKVREQIKKGFWKPEIGYHISIRPDIILSKSSMPSLILDTKWKMPGNYRPSVTDLRQVFTYQVFFNAPKAILIYPGSKVSYLQGRFMGNEETKSSGILSVPVNQNVSNWQREICRVIKEYWEK